MPNVLFKFVKFSSVLYKIWYLGESEYAKSSGDVNFFCLRYEKPFQGKLSPKIQTDFVSRGFVRILFQTSGIYDYAHFFCFESETAFLQKLVPSY